ncbi:MAG: type II toxin-antitoxin system VapC family toxin [Chloroflexota bacterium]
MPVIDASVYIALINANEPEHATCWTWFSTARAAQETILAPVILLAEVGAALSRGTGDAQLADQVVKQLTSAGMIELIPVTLPLAERAATIAANHRIRGCDAIYVALAEQSNSPLVTLDQQQLNRATSIITTYKPQP